MKLWVKRLCAKWSKADKRKSPRQRFLPQIEPLESRETPNSLYNPLFASAFLSLDQLNAPYSIVPGDGSNSGSSDQGDGGGDGSSGGDGSEGGSGDGTGSSQPPPNNFTAADPAAAASTVNLNASLFDSVLGGDDASFAAQVAAAVGGQGQSGQAAGTPGVGAAVVIGLPGPSTPPMSPAVPPDAPTGLAPPLAPTPGTAPTVGVGLSPSEFNRNPFPLLSGATVAPLTPFVVSAGLAVPAAHSGGGTTVTTGVDANSIGYTTTTTDSFAFNATLTQDAAGGLTYDETYSFSYDVQTVPAATGGAAVHDWGASGYTFLANNDGGAYSFTLTAALTADETGSLTQTSTAAGSTSTATTTWKSETQYDRTLTNTTSQATGAATGSDSGGGVATQSSSTTGTYSRPMTIGFGVGTVSGSTNSYSGQGTSYQFATQEGLTATGTATQSGTWQDGNGGYSGDWYSGSGSYAPASGTGSASTPATADATPVPSVSGGPYAPGATLTGGGVYAESGADSMGYGSSDQYSLQNDGSWQASSGVGSSSGTGWMQDNWSGSGGYGYALDGGSVSGTWQQSGGAETNYSTTTDSTLNSAGWTQTGTYASGDGGGETDSYQGSGEYAIDSGVAPASGSGPGSGSASGSGDPLTTGTSGVQHSGGPYSPGATFTGTGVVTESGSDSSGYADDSQYTLGSDGFWQTTAGSGWSSQSGSSQWSYSASGGYGYALVNGAVSGTWQQSGSAGADYDQTTYTTLDGDGDSVATGTYASGDGGGQYDSYQGAGSYAVSGAALASGSASGAAPPPVVSASPYPSASGGPGASGATFSGTGGVAESGADSSGYADSSQYALGSDGFWQQTAGASSTSASGWAQEAYSASGVYGYGIAGGAVSGTWQQSGSGDTTYNTATDSTLDSDGSWTTTGDSSSTDGGAESDSYQGSGNYVINSAGGSTAVPAVSTSAVPSASGGPTASGAAFTGAGAVAESGWDSSAYADSSMSSLGSDGLWQQTAGSSWSSGSGVSQWGYSASGNYGYAIAGGSVSGTWQQSGSANTAYNTAVNSTLGDDGTWTNTGSQGAATSGAQDTSYSGSGSYAINASGVGAAALSGSGAVTESATDDSSYGFARQSALSSDGIWQPATGSGGTSEIGSIQWVYSASGGYTRPLDGGTLSGVWQAAGGSTGGFTAQTVSALNPDGSWTTTGVADSSGSGSGLWGYSASGSYSSSSSAGYSQNGSDSSFSSKATENYLQGWSSQYTVVSTLAANGMAVTVTTASASGSASGSHTYSSSGASSSWSQTGNYAAGNGASSGTSASSGVSLAESMQSQWQENYVITAGPTGTTTTGGASGSSEASGAASWYSSGSGFSESAASGYASGQSWSSGLSGQDNYNDQSSWSEPWNLVGTSASGSGSGTTTDHVWGNATNAWSDGTWSSSQGSGSGSGSGSSTSTSTSGSVSSSYNQDVGYTGFYQGAGFSGMGAGTDGGWRWGVGWAGAGPNGPLGPSAFSSVGYVFAQGDPVSVADISDQSGTEGETVSLQVQASDWSGAALTYSAQGLPPGLGVNATSGLITGTIAFGAAAPCIFVVTVTATDAGGNSASQVFLWSVGNPVSVADVSDQSGTEGAAVSLPIQGTDANGSPLTWTETGLPPGLSIDPNTGVISGTPEAGDALDGGFTVTVTAADAGGSSASQTFVWTISNPVSVAEPDAQSSAEGGEVSLPMSGTDANGSPLTWTETGLPPGLSIDPNSGAITGTPDAGDAESGSFVVTVTATDATGSSDSQTFPWTVLDPVAVADPGTLSATEGVQVSLPMQGTDANGSPLTWTETGLPASLSIDPNSGAITGTPATGDAAQGPYQVTVTATDAAGSSESQTFPLDVAAADSGDAPADPAGDMTASDMAFASLAGPDAVPLGTGLEGPAPDDGGYMGSAPDGAAESPPPPASGDSASEVQAFATQRDGYYQDQSQWQQKAESRLADSAQKTADTLAQGAQLKKQLHEDAANRQKWLTKWEDELDDLWPTHWEDEVVSVESDLAGGPAVYTQKVQVKNAWNPDNGGPRPATLNGWIKHANQPENFRVPADGGAPIAITEEGRRQQKELLAHVQRLEQIAKMSAGEKLQTAFTLALTQAFTTGRFAADVQDQIEGLLSPTNIGIMAAMVGGGAVAQGTPLAPLVDAIGYAMFGSMIFQVGQEVTDFVASAVWATSDQDFQDAADSLLKALATVVVQGGVLFLAHGLKGRTVEVTEVPELAELTPGKSAPKVDSAKYAEGYERIFGKKAAPVPDEGIKEVQQEVKEQKVEKSLSDKPRRYPLVDDIPEGNRAVIKPVPGAAPGDWSEVSPKDKPLLDQDLAARNAARKDLDAALAAGDEDAAKAADEAAKKATEKLGVDGAKAQMAKQFPNAKLVYEGTTGSNQSTSDLDLVYKYGDTYYVVEAKGGTKNNLRVTRSRKVAGGASAQQGSRPYLEYVLDLMKKDGHPGRQTAIALKQALDADNVRYFKADTAIGEGAGGQPVVDEYRLREFDLTPKGTP